MSVAVPIPSFPPSVGLGPRLTRLYQWIGEAQAKGTYHTIWDCCCDHGYLGIQILKNQLCDQLVFVDQVPHIIEQLQRQLEQQPELYPSERYQAVSGDAGALVFDPAVKHLVILAGVGGEHIVDIMRAMAANAKGKDLDQVAQMDFLLCPTTTQFDLRQYLNAEHYGLLQESIVSEKGRDYEVIHVRQPQSGNEYSHALERVSLTGRMWQSDHEHHQRYHNKLMRHYQRQMRGPKRERAEYIVNHYEQCLA
ncbi:tRNA (adenine(22)-N(1))-methyltransferase TrmK [Maricurvus nonylphenolicus]|uniref:tRNA (adenine(22)-N(1))-methyltransferase TrmK n=1 Tax=Maricurvus nonylphenolicus TaxID=1008307 RepID=UPI0036F38EDE